MLKLLATDDFGFEDPAVKILPVGTRGLDQGWTTKHAAVLTKEMSELKPIPGHTYIHVLAVGDTEKYGANRNGDGFSRRWNSVVHDRFVKAGCVHKHHANKDPSKKVGDCVLSAHNSDMSRIELVDALDNEKCAAELAAYEQGKDLPVSMGCRVAYDVCSICGHKAPNPSFYCTHTKTAMGRILDDGRQVYVDNPDPDYFEHSLVRRPADRCGYTFRKVAGDLQDMEIISSTDLFKAAGLWVPPRILAAEMTKQAQFRFGMLQKLAEIEKEIEGVLTPVDKRIAGSLPSQVLSDEEVGELNGHSNTDLGQVFDGLSQAKVMLPLRDFLRLINKNQHFDVDDVAPSVSQQLPGVFGRLLEDPMDACDSQLFSGPGAGVLPQPIRRLISSLIPRAGMGPEPLGRRVSITIIRGRPEDKLAYVPKVYESDPLIKGLANLYATYKLAFITDHGNDSDPVLTRAAILHHYR